jgi:hypothetical protein
MLHRCRATDRPARRTRQLLRARSRRAGEGWHSRDPSTTLGHVGSPAGTMNRLRNARAPASPSMSRRVCVMAGAIACALGSRLGAAAADAGEQPVIVMLAAPGGEIEVQFAPGFEPPQREHLLAWVRAASDAVAGYFGRFPVPQVELLLLPMDGAGVISGVSFGEPSPLMRLRVGRDVTPAQLRDDWILVHEMVHLAVPQIPRAQRWLHEGIATYVESLARGRAGLVAPAAVWGRWFKAMAQGLPAQGDRGLDHTPTWARTYWGGAMFCLVADVRMRQRGATQRGLQQALQGVLAAGGDYRVAWSPSKIFATADAAVGQSTLTDLYRQMKDSSARTDLPALWRELGVDDDGLHDDAPLAAVRRAILG